MSLPWKIAVPVVGIVVLCCAAVAWHEHTANLHQLRLARDAQVSRAEAEQGDADAEARLAHMYTHGEGVPQDYAEALRWYSKAAEQGNASGQDGLAALYFYGYGVSRDYARAMQWSRKAADQGNAQAENGLGLMYSQGLGVAQDYAEALRWYRKAVDQNYASAEYNLGSMYYNGQGVSQDRAEAGRLFVKAANQGDQFALRFISVSLTTPRKFTLVIQFCFSLYLALDFLSLSLWMPGKSFKSPGQKWVTAMGVLGLLDVGLVWYACTHSLMRRIAYGITPFTWLHWSLYAILFAVIVFTVLKRKNTAPETETAGDEFNAS